MCTKVLPSGQTLTKLLRHCTTYKLDSTEKEKMWEGKKGGGDTIEEDKLFNVLEETTSISLI